MHFSCHNNRADAPLSSVVCSMVLYQKEFLNSAPIYFGFYCSHFLNTGIAVIGAG